MESEPSGQQPCLSVVVPVHRNENFVVECLDSVLSQADGCVEVIAVDDSSPDRSGQILDEYARLDHRVRVLHLATNVGPGLARNAGLEQARGAYVWFVDGDDWLPAGALRAVNERLAMTKPDVLVIDHAEVADRTSLLSGRSGDALREMVAPIRLAQCPQLLRIAQSQCTKVVRRAFLAEIGLRFRPGWYEDCAFSHLLLMAAGSIDVLNQVCYCYRQDNEAGITKTQSRRHFEVFDQYEWLLEMADRSAGAYEKFRPELFRLMINHYLVIVGNQQRLPADLRREFFQRIAEAYQRWLPSGGYPVPTGVVGLKHRLVRNNAYQTYATLRLAYRAVDALRRMLGARKR